MGVPVRSAESPVMPAAELLCWEPCAFPVAGSSCLEASSLLTLFGPCSSCRPFALSLAGGGANEGLLFIVAQRAGIAKINPRTVLHAGKGKAAPAYLPTTSATLRIVPTTSLLICDSSSPLPGVLSGPADAIPEASSPDDGSFLPDSGMSCPVPLSLPLPGMEESTPIASGKPEVEASRSWFI